jgi:hypothetical protein
MSSQVEVLEEENEVDLLLLPEKERNKIVLQRERDATKAKDKADKAGKEPKKGGKASKSKTVAAPKRDSSFAQLSVSRLQQLASPSLVDSTGGGLHVHEFFFSGSLLSTDAHYIEQKAFPKEWMDMMAFLEKVCI